MQSNRNRPIHKDSHFVIILGHLTKFLLFSLLGILIVSSLGHLLEVSSFSYSIISLIWPLIGKLMSISLLGIGVMVFFESLR